MTCQALLRGTSSLVLTLATAIIAGAVQAQDLTIGSMLEPGTLDPHFRNSGENHSHLPGMMEYLMWRGPDLSVQPHLITELRKIDDLTYEASLREGVLFHDGSTFDAADVAYVIERIPAIPEGLGDFNGFIDEIERVEIVDDHEIVFHLSEPVADLARNLSAIMALPSELGIDVSPASFDSGASVIGTGPYRLQSFTPGDSLEMVRFDDYWGGTPPFETVTIRPITNDASRVAALISGEVDLIDFVPLADAARLREDVEINVFAAPESRLMFVMLDSIRDVSPYVRDNDGEALNVNPFQDARVRRALAISVDRDLLVERVLEGAGSPAAQAFSSEVSCTSPNVAVPTYDVEEARRLIAEAGYPDGFQVTLHGPSDRYPGGDRVVQALAQFWSQIGLDVEVETFTRSVFFDRARANEYSLYFAGYGATTVFNVLNAIAHTNNPDIGRGAANRGRYSNEEVDALIQQASSETDEAARCDLLERVNELVFSEDVGIIPLYHPLNTWAARAEANVTYDPNPEGLTWVRGATPTQ
ncbi:ABC transporter substrate-binding protein [Boseongicola sp. H5]|uniref:ABC transporter substrate-binding protein n=1 Tax=Boseongicola sp. H5 TaxID=2763261 RepID=UPI001D0A09CF|nr:ABC transporter substrate-binding protein [Boseongicola sp. H5]